MRLPNHARRFAAAAAAAVLATTVAACSADQPGGEQPGGDQQSAAEPSLSPSPVEHTGEAGPPPAALRSYYTQKVEWEDCREGDRCAEVRVPLDYAEPGAKAISLALLKVPAGSGEEKVGSLLVNPGGPGGSGVDYAAHAESYFGSEIRQAFDIVGFDPRGVARSTPIDCLSDAKLDEFAASDPDPDTARERARSKQLLEEFGRGCVQRSGPLAAHISTVEVAKDMDIIRAVLGDERLNYFGASYGTLLGAHYAEMFPERVGRMVLDGAIDPSLTLEEMSLAQARGFETALRSYVGACVDGGDCFLGDSVDAGVRRIRAFLDRVETDPLPTSGDRELTAGLAVLGIWAPLYDQQSWPLLDAGLRTAFDGSGEILIRLADAYTSRGPDGYVDNSMEALYAVNCLDTSAQASIPMSAVPAHIPRFEKASPTFGAIFAYGLASCSTWPFSDDEQPHALHAEGAAPIVVIGTTRDPATPLRWAEALASQLESGVLIRRDGDGHTGYGAGNECVDDAVESYLVSGDAPSSDLSC